VIREYELKINPVPASRIQVTRWGTHYGKNYTRFRKRFKPLIEAAQRGMAPMTGHLSVECDFYVRKPKTTKLDTPRGDLDNYIKALWDGCNGVVWEDDRQIIEITAWKSFTDGDGFIVMRVEDDV
jgi:Holliday junction resolvase RusA-like endonuclease